MTATKLANGLYAVKWRQGQSVKIFAVFASSGQDAIFTLLDDLVKSRAMYGAN